MKEYYFYNYYLLVSVTATITVSAMLHMKCRGIFYPRTFDKVRRLVVPDDKVSWDTSWQDYSPPEYTSDSVVGQPWADPEIGSSGFNPQWNVVDGKVNRKSHTGTYNIVNSYPQNSHGRTGLIGRGYLGRWGPNHAADPIVTRWKRNDKNDVECEEQSMKPVLQFVSIQRKDSGEWAIPGGMVDPGEIVTITLKREFMEEALNVLESSKLEREKSEIMVNEFFDKGKEVYRGYVDDPRNTDNAWMETVAMNFHDEKGTSVGAFPLCAGDDASNVRWMDISKNLSLYASHIQFIEKVALIHGAHW